jgi:hypothetical protein
MLNKTLIPVPKDCPICKNPLLNDFISNNDKKIIKKCLSVNHYFECRCIEYVVYYISVSLDINKQVRFMWINTIKGPTNQIININSKHSTQIPYINPDFSDPTKLLNKIKIYSTFM